jgi:hypothetical protein
MRRFSIRGSALMVALAVLLTTMTSCSAPGHWAAETGPSGPGGAPARLSDVDCPTGDACVAVGEGVFLRRGSSWTAVADPGAPATGAWYRTVDCAGPDFCVVVRVADESANPGERNDAVLRWDGRALTPMAMPPVRPLPMPVPWPITLTVGGVACPAADACVAFAVYQLPTGPVPVTFLGNGARWWIGADSPPGALPGALSCWAADGCLALSRLANPAPAAGSAVADLPLDAPPIGPFRAAASRWDGARWTEVPMPPPAELGADDLTLISLDCVSASFCVAVGAAGNYDPGESRTRPPRRSDPLLATWDGQSWRLDRHAAPDGTPQARANAVSCASATWCVAVGSANGTTIPPRVPLTRVWDGRTWLLGPDGPTTPAGTPAPLNAVACPTTECIGVGPDGVALYQP